jgi:hypothetical protein
MKRQFRMTLSPEQLFILRTEVLNKTRAEMGRTMGLSDSSIKQKETGISRIQGHSMEKLRSNLNMTNYEIALELSFHDALTEPQQKALESYRQYLRDLNEPGA